MLITGTNTNPVAQAIGASARRLLRVVVFSGLVNILTLSGSLYMLQVYDRVIPSKDSGTLASLSLMVLAAYLLQGYLDALRSRMLGRIAAQFDSELQAPVYAALAALPLTGAKPGELQQPLRDLDQVRGFLAGAGPTAFLDMPWIPVFVIVLFMFHPLLGVTALVGAGAIVAMTLLAEASSAVRSKSTAVAVAQRQVLADATRSNADVIRALGMTARFGEIWRNLNERVLTETLATAEVHANLGACGKVLRYGLQSAMLGLGAYLVVNEQATGGIMIASSIVMGRALAPIEVALGTWRQMSAARNGLKNLRKQLADYATPAVSRAVPHRPSQHLIVRNVTISTPDRQRPLVTGVTFRLDAGAGMAVIGASGSGKSTLLRGLTGVWPVVSGDVLLDGVQFGKFGSDGPGQYLGYLPQEVGLFDGAVWQNIARFDPKARAEDIMEAAAIAGAHQMISGFASGYHTQIGQGGTALSAGQRQRIGLARAIYGRPFLVVLDEPNANLDAEGEAALIVAIETLKQRGSAVIVVSHRASALQALDLVMVLAAGRMLTVGTRAQIEHAMTVQRSARTATVN